MSSPYDEVDNPTGYCPTCNCCGETGCCPISKWLEGHAGYLLNCPYYETYNNELMDLIIDKEANQ